MAEVPASASTHFEPQQQQPQKVAQQAGINIYDSQFIPYWARSRVQYAQNLLECSSEPIEYDHEDEDYQDNCFFFPEDCSRSPPEYLSGFGPHSLNDLSDTSDCDCDDRNPDEMIPGLPDIKMLDAEALSDLLEDNLSPPEITTLLVFATNGAIFAYASPLPARQLRNLSATYGAAYTCYAKTASSGNLTGVNPASHPSSYVTAPSVSLGDVGSIVFELDNLVAVVTKIADKVLLAAVGPLKVERVEHVAEEAAAVTTTDASQEASSHPVSSNNNNSGGLSGSHPDMAAEGEHAATTTTTSTITTETPTTDSVSGSDSTHSTTTGTTTSSKRSTIINPPTSISTPPGVSNGSGSSGSANGSLESQYEIDRSTDLARLASLNLSASPAILLALESKSAALGRFLGAKLEDLHSPEDF